MSKHKQRVARNKQEKRPSHIPTHTAQTNAPSTASQLPDHATTRPLRQAQILQLQQQQGNTAVLQLRRPTTTYDFEEGETITSGTFDLGRTGRRPYDVIQDHVSQVTTALDNMRTAELGAIEQFLTHMSFSSSQEAQPDVLGAVFKHVGTQLMNAAIGRLPSVAGIPASEILGVIQAMTDEMERAAAAQQSYQLGNFMTSLRNNTLTAYQTAIAAIQTDSRQELSRQFTAAEGLWNDGEATVVGQKATFLRELEQRGRAMLTAVPQPIQYEEALLTRWITDRHAGGEGLTDWESNGKIQLKFETDVSDGNYSYEFQSAKLFTAAKSGNAADMLTRVMNDQNKKVYELGVPVQVMLRTEGMMPGGRSYFAFWIYGPDHYDRTHWHAPADRAWRNMPWDPIDSVQRIEGG